MTHCLPANSAYQILDKLYAGEPCEIYSGSDRVDAAHVLILTLDPDYAAVPTVAEFFLQQLPDMQRRACTAAGPLQEEVKIPLILEAQCMEAGIPYLVIERYEESPLILPHGLPRDQVLTLLHKLCRVLSALAAAGIVHGHIESSSLLVRAQGRLIQSLILLDLGKAALWAEYVRATRSPLPNRWRNSPYRAPEQRSQEALLLTPEADIYSLGVLFWELRSGKPFTTATTLTTGTLTTDEEQLLRSMLAAEPTQRPCYSQLEQALRALLAGGGPAKVPAAPAAAAGPPPESPAADARPPQEAGETLAQRLARVKQLDELSAMAIALALLELMPDARSAAAMPMPITPETVRLLPGSGQAVRIALSGLLAGCSQPTQPCGPERCGEGANVTVAAKSPSPGLAEAAACYLAPEQLRGGTPSAEARALYAVGAILFTMLGGRPPIQVTAEALAALSDGGALRAPLRISELRPAILAELALLCDSMVAPEPRHRPTWQQATTELRWLQRLLRVRDAGELIDGQYQIDSLIQIGGTAATFRAVSQRTGGLIAIKIPHPDFNELRFQQEIRLVAAGQCPDLVTIYSAGRLADGTPFFAMEFLPGVSLDVFLRQHGQALNEKMVIHLGLGIARALRSLHERDIVHRDVAAENVMIVDDPQVPFGVRSKLIDLGVAKAGAGVPGKKAQTQCGAQLGRPRYWPPEQAHDAMQATDRSDVYATGVLLTELLGCRAFPPPLPIPRGFCSRRLRSLLAAMMARRPEDRPAMAEIVSRLVEFQRLPLRPKRSLWAVPAALVLIAAGLIAFWRRPIGVPPLPPAPPVARPQPTAVVIVTEPTDAELIDRSTGARLGRTPHSLLCPPAGRHGAPVVLELRRLGYEPYYLTLDPCEDGKQALPVQITLQPVVWRISGRPGSALLKDENGQVVNRTPIELRPGERYAEAARLTIVQKCYGEVQRTFSPWKSESFQYTLERKRKCGRKKGPEVERDPPPIQVVSPTQPLLEKIDRKLALASTLIDNEGPSSRVAVRELVDATKISLDGTVKEKLCELSDIWHRYSTKQCASLDNEATQFVISVGARLRSRCPSSEFSSKDMARYRDCAGLAGR